MNNQIKFTTTVSNENILMNTAVKTKIQEQLGGMSNSDYANLFIPNPVTGEIQGIKIGFDIIFVGDNTLSINGKIANNLIEQTAYSSGNIGKVWSINIRAIGTGVFIFYFD